MKNDFTYKYQTVLSDGRYAWSTKSFKSQADLFRYLVEEKDEVLDQRKSMIKRAEGGLSLIVPVDDVESIFTNKAITPVYANDKEAGILKRTIIANTYWWLDSHSDVHIGRYDEGDKAIFSDSIKLRSKRIFPTDQHNNNLDGKIGKSTSIYEAPISWRALGVGKTGMTEALFADAEISKSKNQRRYDDYLNDEIDQHSVSMVYVDQQLAVNDEDKYPKETKLFNQFISKIGNRQAAEKQGYFFAVFEAKLIEYSCVLEGSNCLTPTLLPSTDTGKKEPLASTPKASDLLKFYHL